MKIQTCLKPFVLLAVLLLFLRPGTLFAQPEAEAQQQPEWTKSLQYRSSDGNNYFVGVYSDAPTREEALERSWLNTLISVARKEFPFLQTIKQSSIETLSGAEYRREAALAIERVRFEGIEEAQDKGSPHIVARMVDGKEVFTAYRLLKWSKGKIKFEFDRLKKEADAPKTVATSYDSQIGPAGKATGQLKITSAPSGAIIILDGEPLGRSNAQFSKVSEGSYKLLMQLEGYETVEKQITVQAAALREEHIEFKKLRGTASVSSNPEGALVFVDNIPVGRTPTSIQHEFGAAQLRIELDDYFSESREISFSHRPGRENFDLRAKDGKITVLSTPSGASVYIDGENVGKTPLLGHTAKGGERRIRVSLDQFRDYSTQLIVRASKSVSISPSLVSLALPQTRQKSEFANDAQNAFVAMAPLGKYAAGSLSVISFIASLSASSNASDAYERYKAATSASTATAAREKVDSYDSSASNWKTLGVLSGLLSIGFVIADWDSGENEQAQLNYNLNRSKLSFTFGPGLAHEYRSGAQIALRYHYGGASP